MRFFIFLTFLATTAMAQQAPSLVGSTIALQWQPSLSVSPLPQWASAPLQIERGKATIPVPSLWKQLGIDRYLLTVVFVDTGDTGPVVDWRSSDASVHRLSNGLGESSTGLGLHSRSILIPENLALSGGEIIVTASSRPETLVSVTVAPARNTTVAILGAAQRPALVNRSGRAIEAEELNGMEVPPLTGDLRAGAVVDAELAAGIVPFDETLEFLVPIQGKLDGAVLFAEVLGLLPEARVDVWVNDHRIGELQGAAFRLDDASTVQVGERVALAGWRSHSLFIPASRWKEGDNSIVLRTRDSKDSSVFLKNTVLHLRFAGAVSTDVAVPAEGDATVLPPRRNESAPSAIATVPVAETELPPAPPHSSFADDENSLPPN